MGKKLREDLVFRILNSKRCKLEINSVTKSTVLNIAGARELGNKSWGYISFLQGIGLPVIGVSEYLKKNLPKEEKERTIKIQEYVEKAIKPKIWHSNSDLRKVYLEGNSSTICSEFHFLNEMNEMQSKFQTKQFKKTKEEKKLLKDIKSNLTYSFNNETLLQWTVDNATPLMPQNKTQLTHKQKKYGEQRIAA